MAWRPPVDRGLLPGTPRCRRGVRPRCVREWVNLRGRAASLGCATVGTANLRFAAPPLAWGGALSVDGDGLPDAGGRHGPVLVAAARPARRAALAQTGVPARWAHPPVLRRLFATHPRLLHAVFCAHLIYHRGTGPRRRYPQPPDHAVLMVSSPTMPVTIPCAGRRGHRTASAANCSSLRSSMVATSVTPAFPNWPNSEDGLSYSTQVFPFSSS